MLLTKATKRVIMNISLDGEQMPKKVEIDNDTLIRAVWYYYNLDMTQEQVAHKLGVSRQKAQRMLQEAKKRGLVKVIIKSSRVNLLEIEEQLKRKYSLKDAVVIPFLPSETEDKLRDSLGRAGASYLERILANDNSIKVLGVGWGRTLRALAAHFAPRSTKKRIRVVSLIGNLLKGTAVNPYDIASVIASKLSADYYGIWAPSIVEDKRKAAMFKSEPSIKNILEKGESADIVLVAVGGVFKETPLRELGYLSWGDLRSLRSKGAVGEILGQFFTEDGDLVSADIHNRVIAVPIEKFRSGGEKVVIAVAGGMSKLDAIVGTLNGGFVDVIVTDEGVAKHLTIEKGGEVIGRKDSLVYVAGSGNRIEGEA